jgi:hypothetical protein
MSSAKEFPLDDQEDTVAPEDGTTISDGQESPGLPELEPTSILAEAATGQQVFSSATCGSLLGLGGRSNEAISR